MVKNVGFTFYRDILYYFIKYMLYYTSLVTDPEPLVRFPALPEEVVGLERGPLSLVNTTEELLDRKVAAPV
jgi:hypothetical protein